MRRDFIFAFLTEFLILVSGIIVYRLAANILGKDGFSQYVLGRKTISFVQPVLLMGLSIGVPRYIAFSSANNEIGNADDYFISGSTVLITISFILLFIFNLLRKYFAFLLFGNSLYQFLIFPMSTVLIGLVLHSLCYAYFRGSLKMTYANCLQIVNMSVVPILGFTIVNTTQNVFILTGLLSSVVSLIFLFIIFRNINWHSIGLYTTLANAKVLLKYGIPRVPGDFGMAGLLSLPSVFTAHIAGVTKAGHVAFGVSLLNMVGAVFAPIGLILLPKASQLVATKDWVLLKHYVSNLIKLTLFLSIPFLIMFELFADKIIKIYLGDSFVDDMIPIVRIIMAGSIGYSIYITLRSILDAYYERPINAINIFISLAIFSVQAVGALLFNKDYVMVIISFVMGLYILAGLSLWKVKSFI